MIINNLFMFFKGLDNLWNAFRSKPFQVKKQNKILKTANDIGQQDHDVSNIFRGSARLATKTFATWCK